MIGFEPRSVLEEKSTKTGDMIIAVLIALFVPYSCSSFIHNSRGADQRPVTHAEAPMHR